MKDIKLSRRAFVKASSASLAALSLPTILSGRTNESPASVPGPAPAQPAPPDSIANAWEAGSADSFTRYYFDTLMVETRYMDADLPSTKLELFGQTFDTPIMTAALSHQNNRNVKGMSMPRPPQTATQYTGWVWEKTRSWRR